MENTYLLLRCDFEISEFEPPTIELAERGVWLG